MCRIRAKKNGIGEPAPLDTVARIAVPTNTLRGFTMRTTLLMTAYTQETTGVGLVTGVDTAGSTLTLETRSGAQRVVVAPTVAVRDAHGRALALGDINPGDAVAYEGVNGPAASLRVARQFWAIPGES
jgi:hypothetical protein